MIPVLRERAARLLLYTQREHHDDVLDALMTGADGHVSRRADEAVLLDAIHPVARGERFVDDTTLAALGRAAFGTHREATRLTAREQDVLALMADGLTARQIGERLHIGEGTVKTYSNQIYRKLDVRTRGAAVAHALRTGLVV